MLLYICVFEVDGPELAWFFKYSRYKNETQMKNKRTFSIFIVTFVDVGVLKHFSWSFCGVVHIIGVNKVGNISEMIHLGLKNLVFFILLIF